MNPAFFSSIIFAPLVSSCASYLEASQPHLGASKPHLGAMLHWEAIATQSIDLEGIVEDEDKIEEKE